MLGVSVLSVPCCGAEGSVLDDLETICVSVGDDRGPDCGGVLQDGTGEGFVSGEKGLFVLAPRGTGEGFDKVEGFLCFKGGGADVGPKDKFGVQGEPEDGGVSDGGNNSVVDFEF